jgi:chromosome segregation ATPase
MAENTILTLEMLRNELSPIRGAIATLQQQVGDVRERLDSIDIHMKSADRNITILLQDTRMIRAAVNDIAREHVSAGEVEALHQDVTRLAERMSTVEVRLDQLEK